MSPRTGRPKSESPRTNQISTRMTDEELNRLDDYCAKHQKERASTVRTAVIEFLTGTKKNKAPPHNYQSPGEALNTTRGSLRQIHYSMGRFLLQGKGKKNGR